MRDGQCVLDSFLSAIPLARQADGHNPNAYANHFLIGVSHTDGPSRRSNAGLDESSRGCRLTGLPVKTKFSVAKSSVAFRDQAAYLIEPRI